MSIGEIIKKYRLSYWDGAISVRSFAALCNLSPAYISLLERDASIVPTVETLKKIANTIGLTPEELLSRIDEESEDAIPVKGASKLDPKTAKLIKIFNKLPDNRKDDVLNFANMIFNNETKKK